jgi:VanZ family protein
MVQMKQGEATAGGPGITSQITKKFSLVNWEVMNTNLLGVLCGMVLGGILVAGLWPFHSPKNQVKWLAGGNSVHFGRYGTVLSSGKFQTARAQVDQPCSLEIWFEPDLTWDYGTLFAFYTPGSPRRFSLEQSLTDLVLRTDNPHGHYRTRTAALYVHNVFRQGKPVFVTVTSNRKQVSVYIDGELAGTTSKLPLSSMDFDGELVISNAPVIENAWAGFLRGLAFYAQALSPAQVVHHYETWTENGRPEVPENEHAVALYLFNEHTGRVIRNHVPTRPDLYIPQRYQVVDQAFLKPFWQEFDPSWDYWKDVLVNIAGFVPLGFLFCAYFSLARRTKRPALVTILLGFTVSLTIETLQSFLPTRDSGTTDLITNTLGTCYGAWLYQLKIW